MIDYTSTQLENIPPQIVRFFVKDRVNVTKDELATLLRYGFVPVFVEFQPQIVSTPDDGDAT